MAYGRKGNPHGNKYQGDHYFESYSNQGAPPTEGTNSKEPTGYIGDSGEGAKTSDDAHMKTPKKRGDGYEGFDSKDKGAYIGTSGAETQTKEMDSNRSMRQGNPSQGTNSKMRGGYIGSSG